MIETPEGMGTPISMTAIGRIRRPCGGAEVTTEQNPSIEELRAERVSIVLDERCADGLLGIEVGADILVLCYLDRADRAVLQVHPRGDRTRPLRGVFATRSPGRPNPISVTSARILDIEGTTLHVTGLDILDGTPVLDIKARSAYFDEPYEDV